MDIVKDKDLKVKNSKIKGAGKGLFTKVDIKKGQLISMFQGTRTFKQPPNKYMTYVVYVSDGSYINTFHIPGKAKYANDAQYNSLYNNNSDITECEVDGILESFLIATRDIKAGEEIYLDYGSEYWKYI